MAKKESVIVNEIDKARLKLSIEHYIKYFMTWVRSLGQEDPLE